MKTVRDGGPGVWKLGFYTYMHIYIDLPHFHHVCREVHDYPKGAYGDQLKERLQV